MVPVTAPSPVRRGGPAVPYHRCNSSSVARRAWYCFHSPSGALLPSDRGGTMERPWLIASIAASLTSPWPLPWPFFDGVASVVDFIGARGYASVMVSILV